MDNGDDPNNDNPADYGNEDYGGNEEGANDMNGGDGEADQYFDDAGDIGYLPADHVTTRN